MLLLLETRKLVPFPLTNERASYFCLLTAGADVTFILLFPYSLQLEAIIHSIYVKLLHHQFCCCLYIHGVW